MQSILLERAPAFRQQPCRCKAYAEQEQSRECNRARHHLPGDIDAGATDRFDEFIRRQLQGANRLVEITGISGGGAAKKAAAKAETEEKE